MTYAIKGYDKETYYKHITAALDHAPMVTMDDAVDLVSTIHTERKESIKKYNRRNRGDNNRCYKIKEHGRQGGIKIPCNIC